jgi:hypothetical protein
MDDRHFTHKQKPLKSNTDQNCKKQKPLSFPEIGELCLVPFTNKGRKQVSTFDDGTNKMPFQISISESFKLRRCLTGKLFIAMPLMPLESGQIW